MSQSPTNFPLYLLKNLHIRGLEQFNLVLFKGQVQSQKPAILGRAGRERDQGLLLLSVRPVGVTLINNLTVMK